MSFTIDLILTDVPQDNWTAWKYIEELREKYYEDKSAPHEKLAELHEIIIQKYPCLCSYDDDDPKIDNSPWADGPMIGNFASEMGMLAIVYSRVDEVFPFILENALALGIIVADGQSQKIYRLEKEEALSCEFKFFYTDYCEGKEISGAEAQEAELSAILYSMKCVLHRPDNFLGIVNDRNQTLQFMVEKDQTITIDIPILENGEYIGSKKKSTHLNECLTIVESLSISENFYELLEPVKASELPSKPKWKFW